MNRDNLRILAAYLEALPDNYERFGMRWYATDADGDPDWRVVDVTPKCGTVACAVGHGPAAGIPPVPTDNDWNVYSERVFGIPVVSAEWIFMFDAEWSYHDDTHQGAARRIRYVLNNGVPADFDVASDITSELVEIYQ